MKSVLGNNSGSLGRKTHLLGTKVRNLRKRNNLTLDDLSSRCIRFDANNAPSVSYLSMIELGKRVPSWDMLDVIAQVFQKEPSWFLDDEPEQDDIIIDKGSHGGISGMPLEPSFLFTNDILQIAIPEMLSQTGISGRQFAHLLIVSHAHVRVKMRRGGYLGEVEESFAGRLRSGDIFRFSGKRLEMLRLADGELIVKPAGRGKVSEIPRWTGGRLPLSETLATRVSADFQRQRPLSERILNRQWLKQALEETSTIQSHISHCPRLEATMAEQFKTRDGFHLCFYPFAGWLVHQALGPLIAARVAERIPATLTVTVNDYGIEVLSPESEPLDHCQAHWSSIVSPEHLTNDLEKALNLSELVRRQFRATARISGLIFEGYPGRQKSLRMLQSSAGLLYDVLHQYDPEHVLLNQAKQDVLRDEFDIDRLHGFGQRFATHFTKFWSRCQECLGVIMLGVCENLFDGSFFDFVAAIHYDNAIRQLCNNGHVMGDEHHGRPCFAFQTINQGQNFGLNCDIQCGCGFICDQQPWFTGERHGNHHALAHTAREFVRILFQPPLSFGDADLFQQFQCTCIRLGLRQSFVQF